MNTNILLIPTSSSVKLEPFFQGLQKNLNNVAFFDAIENAEKARQLIANNQLDLLLEQILTAQKQHLTQEICIVKGIDSLKCSALNLQANHQLANALGANIILVVDGNRSCCEVTQKITLVQNLYGLNKVIGVLGNNCDCCALQADLTKLNLPLLGCVKNEEFNPTAEFSQILQAKPAEGLSPIAFKLQLTELAKKQLKTIVLPEGDEPRTVKAAAFCAENKIAKCVLLGEPDKINAVAKEQGVNLGDNVSIINPSEVANNYVNRLVELRQSKGMTEELAKQQLTDTVVLGTMMLEAGEVDGLVSGAVHTTANTIRPPMQIIKMAKGNSLISSIFFMLMPDRVLVFGDCAINPEPSAEQLAEIAIQSADSAKAFGIEPKVALISYSTGNSGSGASVDKVREATQIAQSKRSDLLIDGPLQYDAAIMPDVAKSKAPNSKVAGQANVFIFPDLNTGNTTYKAVQRTGDLISIGPMLQGMRKPVNDLSRGALVEDIIYTIALTAIQAQE